MELQEAAHYCNTFEDIEELEQIDDTIVNPLQIVNGLNSAELLRLQQLDFTVDSDSLGINLFIESLGCLDRP